MTSTKQKKDEDPDLYFGSDYNQLSQYDSLIRLIGKLPPMAGPNPNIAYVEFLKLVGLELTTTRYTDLAQAKDPAQGHLQAWDHSWIKPLWHFPDLEQTTKRLFIFKSYALGMGNPGTIAAISTSRKQVVRDVLEQLYSDWLPSEKPEWFQKGNEAQLHDFMNKIYTDLAEDMEIWGKAAFIPYEP